MLEAGNIKWRKKVTGKFRFKRTGESTYVNLGNVRMHSVTADVERTKFSVAKKGYHQVIHEEPAQVERRFKVGLDEELPEVTRLDLLAGAHATADQAAVAVAATASYTSVKKGHIIQLPKLKVTDVVVEVATVAKTLGTDYLLDADAGTIEILHGGSIADDDDVDVEYEAEAVAGLIQHVSGGEIKVVGEFIFDEFDQHTATPRARYTGSGILFMSNRGDSDGKKFSELEVEMLVTSELTRVARAA